MNDDFSSKVKALLEDPEMLAKITAIAQSLGGQAAPASPPGPTASSAAPTAAQPPSIQTVAEQNSPIPEVLEQVKAPQIPSIPTAAVKPDPRVQLLNSLKPFLRAEKQAKVDTLTRALTVANLFGTMKKKQ